jgi:two-component system, LytTR family, response regulator LytT
MRLLIVEDEPLIAQRLQRFCREILGDGLTAPHAVASLGDAETWLGANAADIMLLDLNLSGVDGMELLRQSVAGSFHTVIVSASTDRALEAFEYGVLDFVPKPFTKERLAQALQRATQAGERTGTAKYLAVKKSGRVDLVAVADVLYVQGAGNYSELVLANGRRELHDKTLERLAAVLPPQFERIHKSFLVRLGSVRALHVSEGSHYEAELKNGVCLPVGRTRYKELREKLG